MNSLNLFPATPLSSRERKECSFTTPDTKRFTKQIYDTAPRKLFVSPKNRHKRKYHKIRREIIPYSKNRGAGVKETNDLLSLLVDHGSLRIQFFYAVAKKLYGRGVRSDGSLSEASVWIEGARLQMGRGKGGFHASHASMGAGVRDNRKEHIIKEIIQEKLITPLKEEQLRSKGFTDEKIEALKTHSFSPAYVKKLVKSIWAGETLFDREFDEQINACDILPAGVNLRCDGGLEKNTRSMGAELWDRSFKALLTPEEATDLYVSLARHHFEVAISRLDVSIHNLKQQIFLSHVQSKTLKNLELEKKYHEKELEGTVSPPYSFI